MIFIIAVLMLKNSNVNLEMNKKPSQIQLSYCHQYLKKYDFPDLNWTISKSNNQLRVLAESHDHIGYIYCNCLPKLKFIHKTWSTSKLLGQTKLYIAYIKKKYCTYIKNAIENTNKTSIQISSLL